MDYVAWYFVGLFFLVFLLTYLKVRMDIKENIRLAKEQEVRYPSTYDPVPDEIERLNNGYPL